MTEKEELWYKDAIIYELHVKAFFDSNGDGVGDMQGLLQKLDYLEDLGVTAIWMLPFYPSPLRDDGYDIGDYFSINPTYGDIKTFEKLVKEADKRGLQVITELVINHTSDQHAWFQRARKSPRGSNYRDYYVWSDDPEKYKDARIIFTDYEPSNWTWDSEANAYYWHRFFHHQPDLNFDNPEVQNEVIKVLDFWVNLGVDGFRLDAVPYLFERDGTNCENLPETHAFLKKLRKHVDEKHEGVLFLAEANMWPEDSASYFGEGDECHMNYHFPIMPRLFMSLKMEDRYPITDIIDQTPAIPDNCQWAIFLRNHDELTLEMVTDEERDYMYKTYTKDRQARINLGIRHRLAPLLENNRKKIELMNTLLFSLPGTPVIYYGDEIGMGDNFYLGDRDGVRTPMQWSPDRNAGFSHANPHKLYLPLIIDPEYTYESVNVETQQSNTSSLLWWMKRTIEKRKSFKAFGRGTIQFLSPSNAKVLAFVRSYQEEKILVLANMSRFSQSVELDLGEFEGLIPTEVFSLNTFPKIKKEPYLFTLNPHAYFWFELKADLTEADSQETVPTLVLKDWESLASSQVLKQVETKVLPAFLKKSNWFGRKSRKLQSTDVKYIINNWLKAHRSAILVVEVNFNEGLPEHYLVFVSFVQNTDHASLDEMESKAIVATGKVSGDEGSFIDSSYSSTYRTKLFEWLLRKRTISAGGIKVEFESLMKGKNKIKLDEIKSSMVNKELSNTAFLYSDKYYLKIFRRLDDTINPDLELSRFLSEQTDFKNIPQFLGSIQLHEGRKHPVVFGMLQEYVPNQGNAWDPFGDAAVNYFERLAVRLQDSSKDLKRIRRDSPTYDKLPEDWQSLIGAEFSDRVELLAQRTAQMHKALASDIVNDDFKPESFSLHYQRSLYSSLQSVTRSSFQALKRSMGSLPEDLQKEGKEVLSLESEVKTIFKRIYAHKIDTKKVRNHGDFHLGQVLWTGKDYIFLDFEGEPQRPFSERRIKRSPLRDVSGMMRSFHYVIYDRLFAMNLNIEKGGELEKWAETWHSLVSGIYLNAYLDEMSDTDLLPSSVQDRNVLIETYLLEKAVYELGYELDHRPEWVKIPMRGVLRIVEKLK